MAVRIRHAGIKEVVNRGLTTALIMQVAERVLAAAQAGAPVDTGEYRNSIHLEPGTTDRAVVAVVAGTDHAMLVEADTGNMRRALDAARL